MSDEQLEQTKQKLRDAFDRMIENFQATRDAIDTPELLPDHG